MQFDASWTFSHAIDYIPDAIFDVPYASDQNNIAADRGNSLQDQGAAAATTNDSGEFDLSQAYPLNQFLILEAYDPRFKNTGYTYQADVDPNPHTVLSSQVDYNFLPVFGNSVTIDFGVQAYGTVSDYRSGTGAAPANENGGIVGTVTYDVTRNELDPAYAAQEDYQPGIPGIPMQLWKTHKTDGVHPDTYSGSGALQQWGISADGNECMRPDTSRGSNAVTDPTQTCKPFDYYVTESWNRPTGCVALDINGNPLKGEMVLPDAPAVADPSHSDPNNPDCIEAPMAGVQVGGDGTVFDILPALDPGRHCLTVCPAGRGNSRRLEGGTGDRGIPGHAGSLEDPVNNP